ncbi:hypothetical protein BJ875DRAFT_476917 [Amylocarpus encephaloides]|uniref:Protection of telomeres protein 1 n=1 Tax=Amylocarpus encephaloides TaxID=45428 RepID=A0A9P7Y7V8_9HELO|nr:hypothetical protein BJ875DRAFT_476917 [Amylocarpus encephaloides]
MSTSRPTEEALRAGTVPAGFVSISEALTLNPGRFVNVIGFVKDFMPPKQTSRDAKCSFELVDPSISPEGSCIKVHYFTAMERMPNITGPSDLIVLRDIKIQNFGSTISLLSNMQTECHVLESSRIPPDLLSHHKTPPWKSTSVKHKSLYELPNRDELIYAIWAFKQAEEMNLPCPQIFEMRAAQSMTTKEKFSLLKDVEPLGFYDLIGQALKIYRTREGFYEIQFSDYTVNSRFHEFVEGDTTLDREAGDEYGYVKKNLEGHTWLGPFGKFTLQITLYDMNAEWAGRHVQANQWLSLKNVRIVQSEHGNFWGKIHGDRMKVDKVHLEILDPTSGPDQMDDRLKEAISRSRQYWEDLKKKQARKANTDEKRKADQGPEKMNSKKRRKEQRAAAVKNAQEIDSKKGQAVNLNTNIECRYKDQHITPFSQILAPLPLARDDDGQTIASPFTLANYNTLVRVVDFFPHRLEAFAVGYRPHDYDILSDYSGDENSEDEANRQVEKRWEWRFALLLEDASTRDVDERHRLWVVVDNHAAEGLFRDLDDATDLRKNPILLSALREKLFTLWGDLEEQTALTLSQEKISSSHPQSTSSTATTCSLGSSPNHQAGDDQPSLEDSDDENIPSYQKQYSPGNQSSALQERDTNIPTFTDQFPPKPITSSTAPKVVPKNKPFTCCIKQYGVKVKEADPRLANAGKGKRWQRMFGLFGATIL